MCLDMAIKNSVRGIDVSGQVRQERPEPDMATSTYSRRSASGTRSATRSGKITSSSPRPPRSALMLYSPSLFRKSGHFSGQANTQPCCAVMIHLRKRRRASLALGIVRGERGQGLVKGEMQNVEQGRSRCGRYVLQVRDAVRSCIDYNENEYNYLNPTYL